MLIYIISDNISLIRTLCSLLVRKSRINVHSIGETLIRPQFVNHNIRLECVKC